VYAKGLKNGMSLSAAINRELVQTAFYKHFSVPIRVLTKKDFSGTVLRKKKKNMMTMNNSSNNNNNNNNNNSNNISRT
jgi:hypothetical protein